MLLWVLLCGQATAHEWTPTYPKFKTSYISGVVVTTMQLYNFRSDVGYYEIEVFDKDFLPVKFATSDKIVAINFQQRKNIDVYLRKEDIKVAVYICSKSKLLKDNVSATIVSSRICSKIK